MDNGYLVRKLFQSTRRFLLIVVLIFIFLLLLTIGAYWLLSRGNDNAAFLNSDAGNIESSEQENGLGLASGQKLSINSNLEVNGLLMLKPGDIPANPEAGLLVFEQATGSMKYYNGTEFISITASQDAILGISGVPGQVDVATANGIATVGLSDNLTLNNLTLNTLTLNSAAPNSVVLGGGSSGLQTSNVPNAGQILLADATGAPRFVGVSGDATLSPSGVISLAPGSVGDDELTPTGVIAQTYGDTVNYPVVTVDANGRIIAASTLPLPGGGVGVGSLNGLTGSISIQGTPNQVNVTVAGNNIYLSLPQDIDSTSSPAFAEVTVGTLTVGVQSVTALASVGSGLQIVGGNLQTTLGESVDLTSEVNGVLTVANGGTGSATVGAAGTVAFSNGTSLDYTAVGTGGQCLVSNGSAAPTWQSCGPGASDVVQLQTLTPGVAQTGNINVTGTVIGGFFAGDGSLLTNLDATNIAVGTLDNARLVNGGILNVDTDSTLTGGGPIAPGDTITLSIADTGVSSGTYGSDTVIPVLSVNTKGQITNISATAIPVADNTTTGLLDSADWNLFAGKEDALSFNGNGLFARTGNAVNGLSCANAGEAPVWNGTAFACADISSYTAGTGISIVGGVIANTGVLSVAAGNTPITVGGTTADPIVSLTDGNNAGEVWQWDGSSWSLEVINPVTYSAGQGLSLIGTVFSLDAQSAGTGQVLKWDGSGWAPGADNDTTYGAGAGLSLSGSDFGINAPACGVGEFLTWDGGAFSCEASGVGSIISFANVSTPNGTSPAADSAADTLTLLEGDGIVISGDAGTDSITITSSLGSSVDLAVEVTGTLPIANGGTGETTAQGAINALSGLTTEGDILYFDGANSTRLPRGADGDCLISNASTVLWGNCASSGSTYFTLQGSSGTPQAVNGGDVVTIAAGTNVTTVSSDDDIVTVSIVSNPSFSGLIGADGGLLVGVGQPFTIDGVTFTSLVGSGLTASAGALHTTLGTDVDLTTEVSNVLPVINGGTGASSLDANGVLVGNGTGAITAVSTVSAGLCLTTGPGGVPSWQSCPGSAGSVASLNSLTGALNLQGTADQITVSDDGVNTITLSLPQNISTASSPTFAGLTVTSLTVGSDTVSNVVGTGLQINSGALETTLGADVDLNSEVSGLLPVVNGGTGANNAVDARTNLGAAEAGANSDITSLSGLTTALSVDQGGTGATSLTQYGILFGNGTGAIQSTAAGSTGECLLATTGSAPTWGACPGSGGVASLILSASNGTPETLGDGDTINIAQGSNVTTTVGATDTVTIAVVSNPTFAGLVTAQAGITVDPGQTLTFNNQAITDLVGTGLVVSGGALQTTLGSSIDLASAEVTGILGIANGGTGETTAQGAINSIAGLTTEGDLLYYDGINTTRLARGTNGQCLTSNGTTIIWASCPGSGGVTSVNTFTGAVDIVGTTNQVIVTNNSGTITLSTPQDLAVSSSPTFAGMTLTTPLDITSGGTGANNATDARTNLGAAASGANSDITSISGLTTALSIAQGGTGATTQQTAINALSGLTTNGDLLYFDGSNSTRLPRGTTGQCLMSDANSILWDDCPGDGVGMVTFTLQGSSGTPQTIGDGDTVTIAAGTNVESVAGASDTVTISVVNNPTFSGLVTLQGGATVSPGQNFTINGEAFTDLTGTGLAFSGGSLNVTLGTDIDLTSEVTGTLPVANGGTGAATLSADGVLVGNGTGAITSVVAGSAGLCLTSTAGSPVWASCPGSAGSVASLNSLTGALNLQGTANQVSITDDGVNTITISLPQDIATTSSPTFVDLTLGGDLTVNGDTISDFVGTGLALNGGALEVVLGDSIDLALEVTGVLPVANGGTGANNATDARANLGAAASGANSDITSTTNLNVITPSDALTVGATSEQFTLQGTEASTVTVTNGTFVTTVGFTNPIANATINFPALGVGNYEICTSSGNCLGGGSGGANTSLSNLSSVAINTSLLPGSPTIDLGSAVSPFRYLYIGGTTTNNFQLSGTASAPRNIVFPDASGEVCLDSGNCIGGGGGAPSSSSYLTLSSDGALSAERVLTAGLNIGFTDGGANSTLIIGTVDNPTFSTSVTTPLLASTGAMAITPGGGLTVGATGQAFAVQGTSASVITAQDSGNTTTVGFITPGADTTINFPALSAGTYTICTSDNNCANTGVTALNTFTGSVTVQGTTNQVVVNNAGGVITLSTPQDINTSSSPTFNGLTLSSLTLGADTVTDITGDGLQVSAGTLSTTLGASIDLTAEVTGVLPVANGGTGANTLGADGVLIGNGTGAISSVTSGSAGLCLISTAGTPSWQACPGSAGSVASINGLDGALNLQGTTDQVIVTDDGVNTFTLSLPQGINTSSSPTFAGITLTSVTVGSDTVDDLTGSGLTIVSGELQTTLGTSVDLTNEVDGTLPIGSGGTGATTQQGAIDALSGLTTNGDLLYHNGANATRLPRGTNGQCLMSNATTIAWGVCPADGVGISSLNGQTGSSQTFANDTNVTITSNVDVHTLNWVGTLSVARGGTGSSTASGARTNLGATTVGANFFTLANPSAVTFARINADNTVSALNAADFRTAIGAGTGDGTVTSINVSGGTTGLTATGGPVTSSGTITLGGTLGVANGGTGATTQQGAINALSSLTTSGDLLYFDGTNSTRLPRGTDGQCLMSDATTLAWQACPGDGVGISSLNGLSGTSQTFAVGNSGTDFNISSAGTVHTFNIPDASGTNRGLVTTGAQTFAGAKTFSSLLTASAGLTVATGQTLSVNGEGFTDLTGTGLTISGGALQTTLGTTIEGSEITNGTITGVDIDDDTIALGTKTTGNYVATLGGGNGIGVFNGTGEGVASTVNLGALTTNWNQTGAFDIVLNNAASELSILESVGGTFFGTLDVGDLTANRTITMPNASGTIITTGNLTAITATGTITSGTWQGGVITDAYINDAITVSSAGTVAWTALNDYPTACAAGQAVTAIGDTLTCAPFAPASGSGYVQLQSTTPGTAQTGHINVTGTIIAGAFSGDGSALTDLNATEITSGTLADARLSSNVVLVNNVQNITGAKTFTNLLTGTAGLTVSGGATNIYDSFGASGAINYIGDASSDRLTVTAQMLNFSGNNFLALQGATDNGFATTLGLVDPTANRSILFPNASGTVAVSASGNIALSAAGNITFTGTLPVANGGTGQTTLDDLIQLGQHTTGDYVSSVAGGTGLAVTGSSSEGWTPTVSLDYTATLAANPALTSGQAVFGTTGLIFEGSTANTAETLLTVTNPTADRTITLPNASGTVITSGNLTDITATGTITSGVWNGTTIDVANGGTGATTLTQYGVLYGNGTGAVQATNVGTLGQCLLSNGTAAPAFTDCPATGTFSLAASSGPDQPISNGNTMTIAQGSNVLTVASATDTVTVSVVDNPTFSGSITGQANIIATSGTATDDQIIIDNASGGAARFSGTITNLDLTADRIYSLPNSSGTVCLDTGNCTGGVSPSNTILQNGNSFGTTMRVGTNDVQNLILETANTPRLTIQSDGTVNVAGQLNAQTNASVTGDLVVDTNTLNVNAASNYVSIGTTSNLGAKLSVVGTSNQTQLLVRANSTQTSPLVLFQNSDGTERSRLHISGMGSIFLGDESGLGDPGTHSGNIGIGSSTLRSNSSGRDNIALGAATMFENTTGSENVAVGGNSLMSNVDGNDNVALGYMSLLNNESGDYNVALGNYSLTGNETGSNNIAIGSFAGNNLTAGSGNIIIGVNQDFASTTGSNQLNIAGILTSSDYTSASLNVGADDATAQLLVLDYKNNNTSDPTGIPGGMYYNSFTDRLRFFSNGSGWQSIGDIIHNGNSYGTTLILGTNDSQDLVLETDNDERLRVHSDGDIAMDTDTLYVDSANNRVGLGTTAPSHPLTIGTPETPTNTDAKLGIYGAGSTSLMIRDTDWNAETNIVSNVLGSFLNASHDLTLNAGAASSLTLRTASADRLVVESDGDVAVDTNTLFVDATNNRVGIGTNSPLYTFHAHSGTNNNFILRNATDFVTNVGSGIGFQSVNDADNTYRGLQFESSVTAFNVNSGGRVGIGTASPSSLLHVAGNTTIGNDLFLPSDGANLVLGAASTTGNRLRLHRSGVNSYIDFDSGSLNLRPGAVAGNALILNSAGNIEVNGTIFHGSGLLDLQAGGSGYVQTVTQNTGYGLLVREAGGGNFLNLSHDGTFSYLSDQTTNGAYFLRGNSTSVDIGNNGTLGWGTNTVGDKIQLYGNAYGIGMEGGTLTNWSASNFRWRIGGTSVSSGTQYMHLSSSALTVNGGININGNLTESNGVLSLVGGGTGYVQAISQNNSYGLIIRESGAPGGGFLSLTHNGTYSYLADQATAAGYFLRANGTQLQTGGNFTVDGFMSLMNWSAAGGTSVCRSGNSFATCSSLASLKHNIADLDVGGLDTIMALQPRQFNWNGSGDADFGFIAEEVQAINPLLAEYADGTNLSGVRYRQMVALTIQGIQDLVVRSDDHETRLEVLESKTTWVNLTVTNTLTTQTITVNGKIISAGNPAMAVLGAQATGGTTSVSGNDIAGAITYTAGSGAIVGEQVVLEFNSPYDSQPRVTLTPTSASAGQVRYWVERTTTNFKIHFIDAPVSGSTYTFDYQVIQ